MELRPGARIRKVLLSFAALLAARASAIPRLIEGNAALRAFTVATKTPRSLSFEPPATWRSLTARTGGLIGIAHFNVAVCGDDIAAG